MCYQWRQRPFLHGSGSFDRGYPLHFQTVFNTDFGLGNNGNELHILNRN